MAGLAPVILRAATQGMIGPALVVSVATAAATWIVPERWKALAGVATASLVGATLLLPSFGAAMGVFVAGGVLLAGQATGQSVAREARFVLAAGLLAGSVILLAGPLVSIPTGIVVASIIASVAIQVFRPLRLEQLGDALSSARMSRLEPWASRWRARRPASGRWLLVACGLVAAVAVVLGIRDQRLVLIDDAAITFRYAVRIASGDGFTYNDGDRTNGASAPLYTLLLALGHLLGWDVEAVARSVGVAAYAGTAALVTAIVGRCRGVAAGALGGFVLLASSAFRNEALSGMESVLAAMLGMLVILLLIERRVTWAGIVLGLAIVNKIDAGFLALAVGSAWLIVHRRPPWRLAATAAITAAPWFLFAQLYFGSVLPFSAAQKIGGEVTNPAASLDRLWILRSIAADDLASLVVLGLALAVAVTVRVVKLDPSSSMAVVSCALWVVLHGAAFSLIDLGDGYPWYTTVLFAPLVAGGVLSLFVVVERLVATLPVRRRSTLPRVALTRGLTAGLAMLLLVSLEPGIGAAGRVIREGHEITDYERFEETRRLAGRYVDQHAAPGEVVRSCYGWIAYGTLDHPFDEVCPLSTQIDPGPPAWIVHAYLDDEVRQPLPRPNELQRVFEAPTGESYVYRVGPDPDDQRIVCDAANAFVELQDMSAADRAELRRRFTAARDAAMALDAAEIRSLDGAAEVVHAEFERAVISGDGADWAPDDPATQGLIALTQGAVGDTRFIGSVVQVIEAAGTFC